MNGYVGYRCMADVDISSSRQLSPLPQQSEPATLPAQRSSSSELSDRNSELIESRHPGGLESTALAHIIRLLALNPSEC